MKLSKLVNFIFSAGRVGKLFFHSVACMQLFSHRKHRPVRKMSGPNLKVSGRQNPHPAPAGRNIRCRPGRLPNLPDSGNRLHTFLSRISERRLAAKPALSCCKRNRKNIFSSPLKRTAPAKTNGHCQSCHFILFAVPFAPLKSSFCRDRKTMKKGAERLLLHTG